MAGFIEGCATTFSCCLKLESDEVKHARALDHAAEEDRKARLEAQRKLQQKSQNAALLGRAMSMQEPPPCTTPVLATPSSDDTQPSSSIPSRTPSRTPSHKSNPSRSSSQRHSLFSSLFRTSRRALSFHAPRQPQPNELAAVVQEDADVPLTVPGPSKALSMGNVKAVYRADTPLARTPATPMPQRPPLFAALLPCCYAPPTTPTVTGRGGAQGVHMRGDDVRGDDGADGELVNQVASGMLAEGDDKGVFTSHANSTLMAHPLEDDDDDDDVDDHSTSAKAHGDTTITAQAVQQPQTVLAQQGTTTATQALPTATVVDVVTPSQPPVVRVTQRMRVRTITRIKWNAEQRTVSQRIDNTSPVPSPRMVLRMRTQQQR